MRTWQVQDAKARFSELVESAVNEGPQLIRRRGVDTAVLVRLEEWHRLHAKDRAKALTNEERLERGLQYLRSAPELQVPKRGRANLRKAVRL